MYQYYIGYTVNKNFLFPSSTNNSEHKIAVLILTPLCYSPGQVVKTMFAVALYQTFGLQFYVPFDIIWRSHRGQHGKYSLLYEFLCRYAITIAICLVAFLVPSIAQIMSFIGAFCLACMGMIFPGLIHLVTFYEEPGYGKGKWILIMDSILIFLGILGFFVGSITAFIDIIENFSLEL